MEAASTDEAASFASGQTSSNPGRCIVGRISMKYIRSAAMFWRGMLVGALFAGVLVTHATTAEHTDYQWLDHTDSTPTITSEIAPPAGFSRVDTEPDSFAEWLRHLPVKPEGSSIKLFDGTLAEEQKAHHAVLDIDIGQSDLQQCADAAIRLRAEYLYSRALYDSISFCFTSGDTCCFRDWIGGRRPEVNGNHVGWIHTAEIDSSYSSLRDYLDTVFMYAGSYSLARDLKVIDNPELVRPGDLFILPGFPGHVVLVADMAINQITQERVMLLAQGYTPAQDFHLLKNLIDPDLSPWYEADFGAWLKVPHWRFPSHSARRFR